MNVSAPFRRLLPSSLSAGLLRLAALFLSAYALGLTISPLVRERGLSDFGSLRLDHWLGLAVWLGAFFFLDRQTRQLLPNRDPLLIPLAALLSGWGLMTVWRLSPYFGLRQTAWIAVCSAVFLLGLHYRELLLASLRRYKYLWLLAGFLITALTFFFGTNPSAEEPRLWLGFGGVYFQPSEMLKLLLIAYLSAYLADRQPLTRGWLPLLAPTALMTGLALLVLFVQRDLGTAWVFIFIYTLLVYGAVGKRRVLLGSLFLLVIALVAGYELIGLVHQRVDIWLNPWADPSNSSYQIVQGLLAVASGGLLGRGPGMGSPGVVPVSHSDFIYTSMVEETGLAGALALLGAVAFLCLRALRISLNAREGYQRYLAIGLAAYLASQSLLIIGGNIRMLPLTGVTLPFVSYGGSSMLASFIALLLLCLVSNEGTRRAAPVGHVRSTLALSGLVLAAFALAAVITGWWTIARGPDLLTRSDNVRRVRSDRFVPRGALLDRHGVLLSHTQGSAGSYQREYLAPILGNVLGYSHSTLGQSGLEASLDPILRGEQYQPWLGLWLNHILYGQPSPGLDVRLSLDAALSEQASLALGAQPGAAVVLDAGSGEVLAMASAPGYNPQTLDQNWPQLSAAQDGSLGNKAVQGAYPPGGALGPFLLVAARSEGVVPDAPADLGFTLNERYSDCDRQPRNLDSWVDLVAAGCPGALAELGMALGGERLLALFEGLGFYSSPDPGIQERFQSMPASLSRPGAAATGQDGLLLSPLQMARAACALSNFGEMPATRLALEVKTDEDEWLALGGSGLARRALPDAFAASMAQQLANTPLGIWELGIRAYGPGGEAYTWHLAGDLAAQDGQSRCAVVLLENSEPTMARNIARALLGR
ncbi:MAG: FtsW/RodA/SpoVE family cell cycle protein [Anaerolineales bacterium]|nr:FtsW/RodA/SpoVE family cell cycle protein [Anaerolineales bacterium]